MEPEIVGIPKVFEGTWDELATHADELRTYKHLKLIALPEEAVTEGRNLAEALSDLLEEARHVEKETPPPHSDPYEKAFGEIMAEKYRKMGFKL